jgi:hypothetical protein
MTKIEIPTFREDDYDHTANVPLHLYYEEGLRVCLGGEKHEDSPDVLIERGDGCWRVFIHPSNQDPDYIIEIHPGSTRVELCSGELVHKIIR